VLAGVIVLVVLFLFAPYAKYIPNASLAGVIMMVAYSMVDKKAVAKVLKSNKNDAAVLVVTLLTTILAPDLEDAIYAGLAISIILFLRDTGTATVRLLVPGEDGLGRFVEYNLEDEGRVMHPVTVIQLEGNLYFGSAADLENKLSAAFPESEAFVLRFKNVSAADISALEVIENFISRAGRDGKKVFISGVRPEIRKLMENCRLVGHVGRESVFMAESEAFASSRRSIQAAYHYLKTGAMPAGCGLLAEDPLEAPAYAPSGKSPAQLIKGFVVFAENLGLVIAERESFMLRNA
jgi:SulP family sulfate permease